MVPTEKNPSTHTYLYQPPPLQIKLTKFQVPHDYNHLHQHFARHHPEMLIKLENGWNSLPPTAQKTWSSIGDCPSSSLSKMSHGLPIFDCWSNSFRAIWNHNKTEMEKNLIYWKSNWKYQYGELNAWRLPDINMRDSSNVSATDMVLALEGYYLMKDFIALKEFGIRWREDRVGLWREIVDFWGFGDVLPDPPIDPPVIMQAPSTSHY